MANKHPLITILFLLLNTLLPLVVVNAWNKWYKIPKNIELTPEQIDFSADMMIHYIKFQQIHYRQHEN